MDLNKLATEVNGERGVKSTVLENYHAITAARQHLWGWREIVEALKSGHPERDRYTAANVSKAYRRVDGLIKVGKLKPASTAATAFKNARPDARTAPQPVATTQPARSLPPGASQTSADVDALRSKGVTVYS